MVLHGLPICWHSYPGAALCARVPAAFSVKGITDMALDTAQGVVEAGAAVFNSVETKLKAAYDALQNMTAIIDAGTALGMVKMTEGLKLRARVGDLSASLGSTLYDVADFHETMIQIAKANGADLPVIAGGGTR